VTEPSPQTSAEKKMQTMSVADTIVQRTVDEGVAHCFGVAGDYVTHSLAMLAPSASCPASSRRRLPFGEGRHVARGVAADIGAKGGKHLRRVDGAHDLPTTGGNAGTQQQTIEVHPLVA